ncbi:glycine cleavage system protein P-like pyridoxal-binding family [Anaerotaenia torta]|uniref:DUF2513 domain-containing protein n=1 Tax=Anaerotaenia torta TaxID=433293 RepID=UPI003D19FADC
MKLNPDCIRDILLTVEEIATYSNIFEYDPESSDLKRLKSYSEEEVMYHLRQCKENNFFIKCTFNIIGGCTIIDLSPKAHQFLADIRSDNIWSKTKETAKSVGSFSLDILAKIASAVATSLINSALAGNPPT